MASLTPSLVALVVANLIPLVGVFFADWDAGVIVLVYWWENIVVGFYNILRMLFIKREHPAAAIFAVFPLAFFLCTTEVSVRSTASF